MKKFSLNKFLSNNKVLFVIAVLMSLSIWIYMSLGSANDTNLTLSNIPIQVELSDEARNSGLQVFFNKEQTASLTVSGNRAVLGSVSESDVVVTAAANSINSSGSYTLPISASKANSIKNFQIASAVTPSTINVVIDYFRENTFDIQDNNIVYRVADGYYGFTSLSAKSITISGPQTEVSKINRVCAVANIDGVLKESTTADVNIVLYDKNNNELSQKLLTFDVSNITADVNVMPEKVVDVKPVFKNKPSGLIISDDMISIDPATILLAGPASIIDKTNFVNLETIDFSNLKAKKVTFDNIGINIPRDCKNLSNTTSAKVTIDFTKFKSKTFKVDKFTVEGLSDKYRAEINQNSIEVSVIGPKSQIESLDADEITAVIQTSNSEGIVGSVPMPVTFKFKNSDSCWAYGTYSANVSITEK